MSSLRFLPVLDVHCHRLAGPHPESEEEWVKFRASCYDDFGLREWRHLDLGTFYPVQELLDRGDLIERIADDGIMRLLPSFRADSAVPGRLVPSAWQSTLDGGLVVMMGDEVVLLPHCCCETKCIEEWLRASRHRSGEPMGFDIGHEPGARCFFQDGELYIQEEGAKTPSFSATPTEMLAQLLATEPIFRSLADRLELAFQDEYGEDARDLARHVSGLNAFLTGTGGRQPNWQPNAPL